MTCSRKAALVLALCVLKLPLYYNSAQATEAARAQLTALNIAPITQPYEDAMVDLQAGHAGLAPIAAPTLMQLTAAMRLRDPHNLNLPNFSTAQLDVVTDFLTFRGTRPTLHIGNPTRAQLDAALYLRGAGIAYTHINQINATIDLQAGHAGLAAVAAPVAAEVNAAAYLMTTLNLANYTTVQLATIVYLQNGIIAAPTLPQLDATIDLRAGHPGLPAIAAPSAAQINAAVALRSRGILNFTRLNLRAEVLGLAIAP
ncbi:MAG: hypothetical protein IBJ00_00175 [Alphaproteobacteria bacterium]|nr:hypothetical protein [Alphaproteobacteria bacterium]